MDPKTNHDGVSFRHTLLDLLESDPPNEDRLLAEFEERRPGGEDQPLYSTILYILTHLTFPEAEAERHWRKIRAHRDQIKSRLGRDLGLRVALLDYFLNVNQELKNPKVIEISIFEQTERSAITDGLTGLFNRRHFTLTLRHEISRARRHQTKVSLVLFDVDDFKKLNDTKGHPEGDKVLVRTASLIKEGVREIDVASRYGGEEFAVILPETSRTGAFVVADRVRQRVENHFRRTRGVSNVTISGGVASYPDDATTFQDLVRKADLGLYRSKAAGKNRITLAKGERRRHRRVPASEPVRLGASGARAAAAKAQNVSAGGVLVSLKDPVKVGSKVRVVLKDTAAAAVDLEGEVVRVTPGKKVGAYDVGVRFVGGGRGAPGTPGPRRKAAPGRTRRPSS
jgi:diguanylate cyclase (GGDEF)-like protein